MSFPGANFRQKIQQFTQQPFPGQQQHQQQQGYGQGYNNYGPPPPTMNQGYGGFPGQSNYNQNQPNYQANSGGYAPPSMPPMGPPPTHYGAQPQYNQGYQNQPIHYQPQTQSVQGQQPYYKVSDCTGRRKALCIGINYEGTSQALRGCHNDAINIQRFLCTNYGFQEQDIVMLLDSPRSGPRQIPTRANMIAAMQWLVRDAQPNDSLFFHYSGHGGQTQDLDGDEDDGNDEVIYPVDHQQAGHLVDDDIHTILVKPLPPGCRLTAIFDSCHSATAMDLPYVYSTEGKIKEPNLLAEAGQGALGAATSYLKGDMGGVFKSLSGFAKQAMNGNKGSEKTKQTKTSPADVIGWSGCKDSQTSADTSEAGKATGAMSYAFITALTQNPQQSYIQLLNSIRDILEGKYSQKPQLSASHPMDMQALMIM